MKSMDGNFFEDFKIGDNINHGLERTITEGDISLYQALTGNRNVLYSSKEIAIKLGYNNLPVDDLCLFNIAFGRSVNDISLNAIANLGFTDLVFNQPAFVGDTINVFSKIIGLKLNSNGKSGIVYCNSVTKNQNGENLLSWTRWVMVKIKSNVKLKRINMIPNLPTLGIEDLCVIPKGITYSNYDTSYSGSNWLWDDYKTDQIIFHKDGIYIDKTIHSLSVNLYQNNAAVHFDSENNTDSVIIYGGHILSLVRKLTYNGLNNSLSITGINKINHVNPVFQDEIIFAASMIIDKKTLNNRKDIGFLRLKTIAFKNIKPSMSELENIFIKDEKNENIILILDFVLSIPRRVK